MDTGDILFEYNGNNTLTARYTHGPGIDDPIGVERGGQSFFYHTDGLGSITEITDSSRQIVSSYSYDAFGNITSQTGSLTNPYTYTGREYDSESGLYYYRARYYDPTIGRFLQPDPLDMATIILIRQYYPASPISVLLYHFSIKNPPTASNLYSYTGNNPINWIDPLGLYGFGIGIAESTEGGLYLLGAGQTGSIYVGLFESGLTDLNLTSFAAGGAFAGGPQIGNVSRPCGNTNNWAAGAYGGGGVNIFVTNATGASDLEGLAKTFSFNWE